MGKGGGGGGTTTVQKADPWAGQQPYLTYGFDEAQKQFQSTNPSYYPDSTVAPLSGTTQQAMDLQKQRALSGNPLANAGQQQMIDTVNGNYLYGNPYLAQNFQTGADAITNAYSNAVRGQTSGFAGGNRSGSGMEAFYRDQANDTLAKNLNGLYASTYGANYNMERNNQINAANSAPTYANMDFANLDALSNVGAAQDANNQNLLDANIDRWNYNQNLDANKLAQYMNLIQGNYGGDSTSTSTPKSSGSNTFGNILGGISTAAGLFSLFSDRRLKTDIKEVGKADNGLTIYSYRYIGGTQTHLGFLADEVEELIPEAVTVEPNGYKSVNYELATRGV